MTITIREAYFESSAPDKPTGVPGRKFHLYYHVLDGQGHLSRYAVVQVDKREVLELQPAKWERAKALV
ncbi:MAG: hypothetical protein AAGB22_08280, partial [Bacteroidota bacterium]